MNALKWLAAVIFLLVRAAGAGPPCPILEASSWRTTSRPAIDQDRNDQKPTAQARQPPDPPLYGSPNRLPTHTAAAHVT